MSDEKSLLEQLDAIAPIKSFDAFPKLPASYKARSKFGGFMTVFVIALSVLLVLNDVAEYIWGWSDYEFVVDRDQHRLLDINVDIVVNSPCNALSIDLRDAVGDRLHLSDTFRKDGTLFDIGQAHDFKEHQRRLSTREIVAASRRSRGFFSLFKANRPQFKKTWNHTPDGSACRVYGSISVRKLSGNFHITTLGHGYGGHGGGHIDHSKINMSHIIQEFSFGPYYPDIAQPLDYSFEVVEEPFVAFQYFITTVPTTYYAPRSKPLHTSQYSVTHYIKRVAEGRGTPGIFFRYTLDPVALEIHQRTTTLTQFLVRIVGVIGGVWVCFGWGIKVATKAAQKVGVAGDDDEPIAEVTGMSARRRWRGANLIRRKADDGSASGWSTPMGTPFGSSFSNQGTPANPYATFSNPPSTAGGGGGPYSPGPYSPGLYPTQPLPPPSRSGSTTGFPPSPSHSNTLLVPVSPYTPSTSPLPQQQHFSAGLAPPLSPYNPTHGGGLLASQQQRERSLSAGSTGPPPPPRMRSEKKDD